MRKDFGWEAFAAGGGPWRAGRGARWRQRWFGAGDMKYVVLEMLRDRPMHGYEVMKELAGRTRGCYSPSPGTVYPTLQWLEDEGLLSARETEGKKVYEITDAGRRFLDENRDKVDDIFEGVRDTLEEALGNMSEIHHSVGRLVKAVYRAGWRARDETVRQGICDVLRRAAEDIEKLARPAGAPPAAPEPPAAPASNG